MKLHVTFYNTEPCREGEVLLIPGQYGGRYSSEEGIAACLRQLAEAGGGSFHHFRVASKSRQYVCMSLINRHCASRAGSAVEGDDIAAMVEELVESKFYLQNARDIVTNYREFCKRVRRPQYTCSISQPIASLLPLCMCVRLAQPGEEYI